MYESFFRFREQPFRNTPDPRFLYLGRKHREALTRLIYAVKFRHGLAVLSGDVGTGKTTIVRALIERLDKSFQVSYMFNPKLPVAGFLKYACHDFGIQAEGKSEEDYRMKLHGFLMESYHAGETCTLIVDEAQHLDAALFEEIRTLTNLETSRQKLLQIVLVGQPELVDRFEQTELWRLKQRISTRYHLVPLDRKETEEYIQTRMRIAGANSLNCFTRGAIEKIYQHSLGVPRLINNLCHNSLLAGYTRDKPLIDARIVRECVTDLRLEKVPERRKTRRTMAQDFFERHLPVPASALILFIGLFVAGVLLYLWGEGKRHQALLQPNKNLQAVSDRKSRTEARDSRWPKREMTVEEVFDEPVLAVKAEIPRDPVETKASPYRGFEWGLNGRPEKIETFQAPEEKERSKIRIEIPRQAKKGSRITSKELSRPQQDQKKEEDTLPAVKRKDKEKTVSLERMKAVNALPKEIARGERPKPGAGPDEPDRSDKEISGAVGETGGPKKRLDKRKSDKREANYFLESLELANRGIESRTITPEAETLNEGEEESLEKLEEGLLKDMGKVNPDHVKAEEEEVKQFLAHYTERYNQKDVEGFLSMFSSAAVQNWTNRFEEIERTYRNFFDQSQELALHLEDVRFRFYQNGVKVRARYEVDQTLEKGGKKRVWRGVIHWILFRENGALRIRNLDYVDRRSHSRTRRTLANEQNDRLTVDANR